jgi:tetratricopeptide (TPR) repeat protein
MPGESRGPFRLRFLLAPALFAAAVMLYLYTTGSHVLPGDSGELISASYTLSIAHPPGYPLYVMAGRIFALGLDWSSVAMRYNLFSAVCAAGALAVLFLALVRIRIGVLLALAAVLVLGSLGAFHLAAVTAEVYALNALFTALMLYAASSGRVRGERAWLLLGYLGGLALSHHLTLLYPLLGAVVLVAAENRRLPRARTIVLSILLGLLGLSTWLFIPVRAAQGPPITWDRTDTLSGFIGHITAQGYSWRFKAWDLGARAADLSAYLGRLTGETGLPLTVLALAGLVTALRRPLVIGALVVVVCFGIHYAAYSIPDIESHLVPAVMAVAVLAVAGLDRLVRIAGDRRILRGAAALGLGCLLVLNAVGLESRQMDYLAESYATRIVVDATGACGEDCLILAAGDPASFPLLYMDLVVGRPIQVFDMGLSNPDIIGAESRPRSFDQCVEAASEDYPPERIAFLGPVPQAVAGRPTTIVGMVSVFDRPGLPRLRTEPVSPDVKPGSIDPETLRDHASRLLAGSHSLQVARWLAQEGDTTGAVRRIERAAELAADDAGTSVTAARMAMELGRPEAAFRLARRALDLDPGFFEAHGLMASLLFMTGRGEEAVTEYRLALEGNPNPGPVYSNLGNALHSLGRYGEALDAFAQALAEDSTLVNAHVGRGRAYEAQRRIDLALQSYRRARRMGGSPAAYHGEASLLLARGRHAQAQSLLREGLALEDSGMLLSDLGLVFLRQDMPDSAVFYLRRALHADPDLLAARGNLALAYEITGNDREAVRHYRIYVDTAPPGRMRDLAAGALKRLTGAAGPD